MPTDDKTDALEPLVEVIIERLMLRFCGPRVLSIKHAASYLDCTEDHIRNLLSKGLIKYVDIGLGERKKMARIAVEELDRYLDLKRRAA